MNRYSYRERDYAFGRTMVSLRSATKLTQAGIGESLGVSRRTVGSWEKGDKYPAPEHLKRFIALALEHGAFPEGQEDEAVRALWQAAQQKGLLDEVWLATLLSQQQAGVPLPYPQAPRKGSAALGLPLPPNVLIGREVELAELTGLLGNPACRLLTLLGPGGIGKTRLALELAHARTDSHTGDIAFVDLAAITTPNQIVTAIAEVLGLSLAVQMDATTHLLEFLQGRHLLLILDNFEHLLVGSDLVQDMLQRAPQVNILVTSRERLNLQAEWLFDVEGLSYPAVGALEIRASQDTAELSAHSAVQLFIQRASQVRPALSFSQNDFHNIVCICQHVEGLPLAIELAAAAVRVLPIAAIERQIRSNVNALSTTLRDVPSRHRSMRAVFDHSWNLLSEQECALLGRLAVFRGGFTLDAAEQVAGGTLSVLAALTDKSLVRQIDSRTRFARDVEAEARFVLLEPVREYAFNKLTDQGDLEATSNTHASYYLVLAESVEGQWDTPSVDYAIGLLERELDNLRVALQWTRDGGDRLLGLQLAGSLWRFWRVSSCIKEGRQWLRDLLERTDDGTPNALAMSARLRALHGAAWLASDQHDFEQARLLFQQSADLRHALGKPDDETNLLVNEARQARTVGRYGRALPLLEDALSRYRASGNRVELVTGQRTPKVETG